MSLKNFGSGVVTSITFFGVFCVLAEYVLWRFSLGGQEWHYLSIGIAAALCLWVLVMLRRRRPRGTLSAAEAKDSEDIPLRARADGGGPVAVDPVKRQKADALRAARDKPLAADAGQQFWGGILGLVCAVIGAWVFITYHSGPLWFFSGA